MAKPSRPAKPMENVKPEPRQLEEIKKQYYEAQSRLGNARYLEWLYKQEAEHFSNEMLQLNQESDARKKLDAAKSAEESKNETAQS